MFGSLQSIRLLKQTISSSFFIYHFFLFIIQLYIVIYSLEEKGPCTWAASPPKEPLPSLIPSVLTASALQGFPKCAGSTLELLVKHFKRALLRPPQSSLVKLSKHLSRVGLTQCWGQLSCGEAVILPKVPWFSQQVSPPRSCGPDGWFIFVVLLVEPRTLSLGGKHYGHPPSDLCFHQSVPCGLLFTNPSHL